jgi:cytochrome c5
MRILEYRDGRIALRVLAAGLLTVLALALAPRPASAEERSGKEVVDAVCASCHASGAKGAPRIGDRNAWKARASQGLSSLTRHALEGIRNMPAHGGSSGLSDLEIGRAVAYMVNRSGGKWIEPASAADLAAERTGEQVVKGQCIKCHEKGVGGAPRIGDQKAWVPRMKNGLDTLVRSAIRGHGGMPPRGGQANLSDSELRSAIIYMFNPGAAPAGKASRAGAPSKRAAADPNHETVGGIEFFLGFVKAESLYSFPSGSVERTMHGGIPKGKGYYHINVTLRDAKSQAPVEDASVELRLEQPGLTSATVMLEPLGVGAGSYGNYVKPARQAEYLITVSVRKRGSSEVVDAKFDHRFD